jgi:hypothetical protein
MNKKTQKMFQNYKFSKIKKFSVQYLFTIKLLNRNNYTIKNYINKSYSSFVVNSVKSFNKKWTYVIFSFKDFNSNILLEFIIRNLNMNSRYSLLFKLGLIENRFLMLGPQIGLIIKEKHNYEYYKNIHLIILDWIESFAISNAEIYKKIVNITILYKELDYLPELVLENINLISTNNEKINKQIFKKTVLSKDFSSKYIPLTVNTKHFGSLIEGSMKKKYIDKLKNTIKNLSGITIPDYLVDLNLIQVYLRKSSNNNYYLIVSKIQESNSENLGNKSFLRYIYNLKTGICLYECVDIIKDSNLFIRTKRDTSLVVRDNKITDLKKK